MNKKKHITNAEHIKIETLLSQGFSIRSIADFLEKSPSTISREIQKLSLVKIPNSCDCNEYNGCNVKHVCGSKDCNKKCRLCHLAKKYCEHYNKRSCEHWNGSSIKLLHLTWKMWFQVCLLYPFFGQNNKIRPNPIKFSLILLI